MQVAVSKYGVAEGVFKSKNLRYLPFLFLLLFLMPAVSFAQNATIVGTVTDPSGAVMPNVNVTATNPATGWTRTIPTNDAGQYVVPDIQIGHYNIKAEASGFKTSEQKDVVLQVGDRLRIDFQMKVGTSAETITVEANAIAVQADSGEMSNVITSQQVAQLAVNGRGIYQLAALAPGASSQINPSAPNTPVGGDAGVEFNGMRQNHNIYLLDGGENDDRGGAGGMSIAPSSDAIAEFRALTSNYSADYGLSSGGTMTLVLKSGTSRIHASAWEFNRNDALDARNFFNPAPNKVAKLRQNVFGFNVGGPVTFGKLYNPDRKKTFFFYNMEWRRYINGGLTNQTVPDTATYGGNFSSLATPINVPSASQVAASVLAKNCPGGVLPAGIVQGSPFPGNVIPSCMISPNSAALVNAGIFPAPTSGTQFVGGNDSPTSLKEEIVRIDHNFNSKFSVFGHFVAEQVSQGFGISQWSGANVPTVGDTFGNPSYSGVIHTTYVISPTLMNEVAFNYNGNRINIIPFAGSGLASLSLPTGYDSTNSRLFGGPNNLDRMPNVDLNGSTGAHFEISSWPWTNKADDYQIRDDISWTKGSHQLKFGASWAIYKKVQDLFGTTQGSFNYDGTFTGNDFADMLLGTAKSYNELAVQDSGKWNNVSWAAYVQDNWRVNRRLTLNLGLRWDGVPHTYEADGRTSNFYPSLYDPAAAATFNNNNTICGPTDNAGTGCPGGVSPGLGVSPNPILAGVPLYLNGIGTDGKNGIPKGLVHNHWAAFGPRLGFAYDLTGSGKTVVRGGFGIMYERIQGNDMYNAGPNIPFSLGVTLNSVTADNPSIALANGSAVVTPINPADITGLGVSDYKLPASYQWSIGVQRALNSKSVLSIAYVGNQNRHQNDYNEYNLPDQSVLPDLIGGANYSAQPSLPFRGFHSVRLAANEANSHYNGLQIDLNSQIKRDLQLRAFYTLSRTIDPTTGGSGGGDLSNVSNPYLGWKYDDGPGGYDRTHNVGVNFIYDIPVFRNTQNRLVKTTLGGWQISGIITVSSGLPINVGLSGGQGGNGLPNATNRPDLVGSISYPSTVLPGNQKIQYID
ncbi:MAG TPA: carboxypeptidase-like regulatory domain-containing protein, partial [Candidatus Acidoferrum sp.]|nr:carboxypeptidase-like regulatory domain-containing protein [Candidatus Acidoferrum sp.]